MKKQLNLTSGTMRAVLTAAVIFGLLAGFALRQTAQVSAQENEIVASPQAADFTFSNFVPININDNTVASPYPSNITVNNPGLTTVTKVQVKLFGFRHTFPDDVDIILVGPQGQRAMLMSDAGGGNAVNAPGIDLTFSQTAATILPDSTLLTTGTYRPANYETTDTFPAPGPGTLTNQAADLSVFNLTNPNGTWNLYVVDDTNVDAGQIPGGWDLILTVPTIFTVNSTADTSDGACNTSPDCTLREAITAAGNGDLINFSPLFNTPQTINLLTALPDINRSVTIQGKGANLLTVRRDYNAATDFRIFTIAAGLANGVAISGITITGGNAGHNNFGGGINSFSNLTLTNVHVTGNRAGAGGGVILVGTDGNFTNCTFSNNSATNTDGGGGIYFEGEGNRTLRLVNSTVSGNRSFSGGSGGIFNFSTFANNNSKLEIISSTIAGNSAATVGGGILTFTQSNPTSTATTTLRNTIIANNTPNNLATGTSGGGAATFMSLGFNLSDNFNVVFTPPLPGNDITSATPRLGPLSLGGGTTPTHALLHSSPAINAGDASGFPIDQRGQIRLLLPGTADIGSVEMRPIVVLNTNNIGAGSLRQAIDSANSLTDLNDILFDNTVFSTAQIINLTTALPDITSSATINGTGANLLTVRRDTAAADFRIFNIPSGITGGVAISGVTITGGRATGDFFGGGILSRSNLTLTNVHVTGNQANAGGGVSLQSADGVFTGCTFSGNTAGFDGGINYQGDGGHTLRLTGSTVSGNNASGGGITNISTGGNSRLEIVNSTIASNTGGGILTFTQDATANTATTTLRNSIIALNTPNNLATGTNGGGTRTVTTHGFNLASDNGGGFLNVMPITTDRINAIAGLAALADNGGATPTRALLGTSAALDAGNNSGSGTLTDQRGAGFPRTVNLSFDNAPNSDGTDIGAFEAQTTPPLPTVSVNDATAAEGDPVIFTITLSAASGQTVTLTYNTTGGTATPDVDYNNQNSPATLTFAPGTTTQTVSVPTFEDSTFEPDETFNLNILSAVNATIADNLGIGTIQNDDPQPTISINDVSLAEGNSGTTAFNFNVTLSNASSQTITVNYATADGTAIAGQDYTGINITPLSFAPEATSQTVTVGVNVNGDTTFEPNETFFVNLSSPTNATIADNQGIGTIQNDDAPPQIFTVINTNNDGAGSLRAAITAAQNGDLIQFSSLFNTPQTINLLTELPEINRSITIQGKGANLLTVRRADAAPDFRIFVIASGVANGVAISAMTISNGRDLRTEGFFGFGGGIHSLSYLTLTNVNVSGNAASDGGGVDIGSAGGVITGCTLSNNTASGSGGGLGLQNLGTNTVRLVNSTVSGNRAGTSGGGIINVNGRLEITGSTIANNSANGGGGIFTNSQGAGSVATTTLRNTIIAGNSPNNLTTQGGAATFQTLGFNLSNDYTGSGLTLLGTDITDAPRLAPLALYGGQMPTHALLHSSPAIDQGNASGLTTDQRGVARVFDTGGVPNASDGADIGAVEMRPIVVLNANDAGSGSLRQAISTANSLPDLDDIIFDNAVFNTAQIINLLSALPNITSNTTINGAGANLLTVRRDPAAADFRIFNIPSGITGGVAISGMTITGGRLTGDFGGGILSESNLTLTNVHVTGNQALTGGGVDLLTADGVFTGCTFSGNTASFSGGGINFQGNGGRTLRLVNSTVSGNQATNSGGGIRNVSTSGNSRLEVVGSTIANNTIASGITTLTSGTGNTATTTLRNSIIAGNTPNNLVASGSGATVITHGFNLASDNGGGFLNVALGDKVNVNPLLAALANNGGTTQTQALLPGSPAIDAGNNSGSGTLTDQRGGNFRRTIDLPVANALTGDGTDIGAFEALAPTAATVSIGGRIFTPESRGLRNAVVTLTDQNGNVRAVATAAFGYYRFDEVAAGATYIISVQSKRYRFAPQVVNVTEAVDDLNFTAER